MIYSPGSIISVIPTTKDAISKKLSFAEYLKLPSLNGDWGYPDVYDCDEGESHIYTVLNYHYNSTINYCGFYEVLSHRGKCFVSPNSFRVIRVITMHHKKSKNDGLDT